VTNELAIEVIAPDGHPGRAQNSIAVIPIIPHAGIPHTGAEPQQREIARAAAEVGNEHQLIVVELGFIIGGGCDGLILE
jgi:hypothetical protein